MVKPQAEEWSHGVRVLGEIAQRHPQLAYSGLGMPLQLEWQYLQRNVLGIINPATMGYISVVVPSVKVNRAEEGMGNTEFIMLWF